MARQRMVTRTITTTEVSALCLDILTSEPCTKVVTISGIPENEKKLEKVIRMKIDTDDLKFVSITSIKTEEELYGMTEEDFITHATVLPARNEKEKKENK